MVHRQLAKKEANSEDDTAIATQSLRVQIPQNKSGHPEKKILFAL